MLGDKKESVADYLKRAGIDTHCMVCGKIFRNFPDPQFHRDYCCVRCEVLTHDWAKEGFKTCEHGYWKPECVECNHD